MSMVWNMKKLNCWEFKKCGRELDGRNVSERGVCPVASEQRADSIHRGTNGGRSCWAVSAFLHAGRQSTSYAEKFSDCGKCDFYNLVRQEEYPGFKVVTVIWSKMGHRPAEVFSTADVPPAAYTLPAPAGSPTL
jgi:hypothetical protein